MVTRFIYPRKDAAMASGMSVGIREAKMRLSQLLKMVQQGNEIVLTERGRPVGKIVPMPREALSLEVRVKELEQAGVLEPVSERLHRNLPPPIPVRDEMAQRLLREDREGCRGGRA
jgi:prevent-host-death family protein